MQSSKVFFTNLRTTPHTPLTKKMENVALAAGFDLIDFKDKFVAVKIHFGEAGNLAYLRPNYAAHLCSMIRERGGKPFLTDSNTLYSGSRSNAVDHLKCAMENGYNPLSAGANVIIADGIKGTEYREIPINGKYCPSPKIGSAIADADIVISMTHFKGHEQTGFGGVLKNLGMGSASRGGKLELHSSSKPVINRENCKGCGVCVKNCSHGAISFDTFHKAIIDYDKCVGCGQCVALCQFDGAVLKDWDGTEILNFKIAEYAKAVIEGKPNFHISFIVNVSPECDCWCHNDAAIIPDLGIAASLDPVALDQACADMVVKSPIIPGSKLFDQYPEEDLCGKDKFHIVHPDTDWKCGLKYAEEINIGTRNYELKSI